MNKKQRKRRKEINIALQEVNRIFLKDRISNYEYLKNNLDNFRKNPEIFGKHISNAILDFIQDKKTQDKIIIGFMFKNWLLLEQNAQLIITIYASAYNELKGDKNGTL